MPLTDDELIGALQRFNGNQIGLAGQRYTPGIEPGAPNIRIAPLLTAIDSLACGPAALSRFREFVNEVLEAWRRAKHACERHHDIQAKIDALGASVSPLLTRMRARDISALEEWRNSLTGV